ncbi:hypothetical protein GCM10010517_79580 [Streptosporangium fragile]|uniref:Transposase IS116/IS110/IS902 C-terminal domain-containing protein n=1 Tax=Streptosporangium fragile TaxID=46186 RepID=A0ABN3WFV6_9ACTN
MRNPDKPPTPRLMAVVGVNVLPAAKLLGEAGDITRFRSSAAFARRNGTAPIPAWSGNDDRHRLDRGGNPRTGQLRPSMSAVRMLPPRPQPPSGTSSRRTRVVARARSP